MLVFIAPYSASNRGANVNLGAARKVEFFLALASQLSEDVLLINTGHIEAGWSRRKFRDSVIGTQRIREISLRCYPVRPIGKLLNLFEVLALSDEIAKVGKPEAVWIYNAYAFESMLARVLTHRFGARLILQFEDWLLSRRRWHPKPLLDFIAWRYVLPAPSLCLAVNDHLSTREHQRSGCPVVLCPGVVSDDLIEACGQRRPFSRTADARTMVGYFGGLSVEKGADVVLDLIRKSGGRLMFHVCGTGPLAREFVRLSAEDYPVHFHGRVDEKVLFKLISDCDVLVNPHVSIEKMGNGVFPFKVVEYVASGRLVISTELPPMSMKEIHDAICFVSADARSIADALANAEQTYRRKRMSIERAMKAAAQLLTRDALERSISRALSSRIKD
ncbi:glycosyltransferase [Paraburkholderia sp. UCT2]|uniref:glycosyltransferase n=1 Tax=Paraburkholderia sp. UCT2 TaxID=2615208 RepID=UPI0016562CCA|nr:glycosyltransferase [Paraburkholderia sp. UCT2]MBC8730457.1 glycosyltransferase family 4 protein [Paraburkholderia sp. UCT2]